MRVPSMVIWQWDLLAPEICLPRLSPLGSQKSAALDPGAGEQGTRAVLLVPTEEGSGSSLPLFFSENELYGLEVSWQGCFLSE